MKSVKLFGILSLLICGHLYGQQKVEKQQWSLDVLLPGVSYEIGLSEKTTLNANIGFGFEYINNAFFGEDFGIFPSAILQYRSFYNLERRVEKGKRIDRNTGNYIAPILLYQSGSPLIGAIENDDFGFFGAVYGLQRTGRKGFQWNFLVGPGVDFDGDFSILLTFKLGFVLGKK